MRLLRTGDPCPCCGEPIELTDPEALRRLTAAAEQLGLPDRRETAKQENEPLTLGELERMARKGLAVWCVDRDGAGCGVLSMREDWWDNKKESPYICLPNEERGMNQYSVEFMLELGAEFYRRRPEASA